MADFFRLKGVLLLALVIGSVALIAAQCGANPTPQTIVETVVVKETVIVEGTPQIKEVVVTKEVEVVVTPTPAPAEEAQPSAATAGGEVKIGWDEQIPTLDPQKHVDISIWSAMINVQEPLVFRDRNGVIQPLLATSWKRVDDLTWEFKLREGVSFHNGEPFNAAAVKFTFDRLLDPATESPQSFLWAPSDLSSGLEKVEVVDDTTVRFITSGPFGALLATLPLAFIMPPEAGAQDDYNTIGYGTGPFKVVEYDSQKGLFLEANPDYWGGAPKLSKVSFIPLLETATRLSALRAGDVDIINAPPIEEAEALQGEGFKVINTESNDTLVLAVGRGPAKQNVEPWTNPKFVEAVTYAIDRNVLADSLFAGVQARPATSVLSPGIFGYCRQPTMPRDLEKAKAALKEAGVEAGLKANIVVPDGVRPKSVEVAQALVAQLADIGIEAQVVPMEPSSAWPVLNSSDFDFFLDGWGTMTMDADFNLFKNFHISGNREGTDTPELNELLAAARESSNDDERADLYCQAQQMIWNGVSRRVPLYHLVDIYAYNARVEGWEPRHDKMMPMHDVSVAE